MKLRLPLRRDVQTFDRRFRWMESCDPRTGVRNGRWICGAGPSSRYAGAGVISHEDSLACMLGDAEWLTHSTLEWFDSQTRTAVDWQSRWKKEWPLWLWPEDTRPFPDLVLELARKAGIAPRLANNAPDYNWVTNEWRAPKRTAPPQQLVLVLGVGLRKKVRR